MEFVICFDMRAPDFGAPKQRLYDAALDMCAWADDIGHRCTNPSLLLGRF